MLFRSALVEVLPALLADTGAGPVEDVARRHLGVDLGTAAGWQPAIGRIAEMVETYTDLAAKVR